MLYRLDKSWLGTFLEIKKIVNYGLVLVPRGGIEPPLPKEADFESAASTNSAPWAIVVKE